MAIVKKKGNDDGFWTRFADMIYKEDLVGIFSYLYPVVERKWASL